ncbi:hypothetical protein PM082_018786 [Marasmius tenuissimus]|nr:hypothetical protein PM082_018786 [Marasmius tenuissimus]
MDSHISLSSSSPSSSAPPIARSLSLKDRKVNRQSNTPNRSRFSLNLNLLLPSPSLNKVSIPTSLESQLNGEGAEGRCRIVGITRKRHARLAVPPSAMKYYDCSELCSSTEDEHDLVGGLSCFGSPKRKLQRTRTLSTRAYEKQPAGEEMCSPAYRIQQEWRAKNEVLIRARSYTTRQLRVVTESSGGSSGGCPPLPSPCEGLFESSRTTRRPLSLTIALPAPSTTTGYLLSLPPDPDSWNLEEQGLPVPLPLSPLLSPALSHIDTGCASAAGIEPPSPTFPPSPFRKLSATVESSCGHYSLDDDSSRHRHNRWISDSQSSDAWTPSTCSNQDLRLSQDIESVINYAGQKLRKTSSPPKTWAEPHIIREDSMENFGVVAGVRFEHDGGGA